MKRCPKCGYEAVRVKVDGGHIIEKKFGTGLMKTIVRE